MPVLQGFAGPSGCGTECLKARTRLEHCVVRREYSLRRAAITGLTGVSLDRLMLHASCEWWALVGNEDVRVNASVAISAIQELALLGDLVETSRCLV